MALDSLQPGTLYPKLKITCPAGVKKILLQPSFLVLDKVDNFAA